MARHRSSEVRSGTTPDVDQHGNVSHLESYRRPVRGDSGPVPEGNSPGHRPEHDQDQPDLDAFAARFSGRDLDDLPTVTGVLDRTEDAAANDRTGASHALRRWAPPVAGLVALAALAVYRVLRRRS